MYDILHEMMNTRLAWLGLLPSVLTITVQTVSAFLVEVSRSMKTVH